MSKRKKIETLFQEKFKDFEAIPAEQIWINIEAKLDKEKQKRIIPFWFKFSGVAAVLLVGFLIGQLVPHKVAKNQNPVVMDSKSKIENKKNKNTIPSLEGFFTNEKSRAVVGNSMKENSTKENFNGEKNNIHLKKTNSKTAIVSSNNKRVEKNLLKQHSNINRLNKNNFKTKNSDIDQNTLNTAIAENTNNNSTYSKQIDSKEKNISNHNSSDKEINLDLLKDPINSNSKIVTTEKKVNDTVSKNSIATNALEELLNEKESKVNQKSKENRWQITSNVAPVFLGSVTNGSPVDSKFEDNSKHYNTNMSVGLGVSYAINSKLSVRTGINKMAVDYDTNDVAFYAALQASSSMTNLNPTSNNSVIVIEDAPVNTGIPNESVFFQKNEGYLNQRMGYYEVPLELTYGILNKKFGIKIISGISTFFLNENKITVVSGNLSSDLGRAKNLNDIHFSTNLGLGLKYSLWKSLEFNVEPTFKYQLNTFNSNTGNFKPYVFGLYSGLSYRF